MNAKSYGYEKIETKVITLTPKGYFKGQENDFLYINQVSGRLVIKIEDILYCKAESNYTIIFISEKKSVLVSKSLKVIESRIDNSQFIRIHASYLVNKSHVNHIAFAGNAELTINNKILPVARARKKQIKEFFKNK